MGYKDSSPTGVTLKCVKDPFTRKGLVFNLAKKTFIIGKAKKICVFQVTWNLKIGTVGRIFFYFVKSFYMGKMGKQ